MQCRFTEQKGKQDGLQTTHAATSDNSGCNCRCKSENLTLLSLRTAKCIYMSKFATHTFTERTVLK